MIGLSDNGLYDLEITMDVAYEDLIVTRRTKQLLGRKVRPSMAIISQVPLVTQFSTVVVFVLSLELNFFLFVPK